MRLSEHIKQSFNGNHAAFGRLIGRGRLTVLRYCSGEREPDALMKQKIIKETNGEVTLDDMHQTRLDWLKKNRDEAAA